MIKRDKKCEWVVALDRLIHKEIDEVPKGWKTREQIAVEMGVSSNQASKVLKRLKDGNMLKVCKFKVKSSGKYGIIRKIDHYMLCPKSQ